MYVCTGRSQCTLLTWFTPYTMFSTGCGSFTGADTTTFLQPCTGAVASARGSSTAGCGAAPHCAQLAGCQQQARDRMPSAHRLLCYMR